MVQSITLPPAFRMLRSDMPAIGFGIIACILVLLVFEYEEYTGTVSCFVGVGIIRAIEIAG